MRVLVLVDAWNFALDTDDRIGQDDGRNLWYAALGNLLAFKLQYRLQQRIANVEVRLYLSRTGKETTDWIVKANFMREADAKELGSRTRAMLNEDDPAFQLRGTSVVMRAFQPHSAHWRRSRVRLEHDPQLPAAGYVYVHRDVAHVREKAADTMLSFEMAVAAATGECDILVVCTQDTDQRSPMSHAQDLAARCGHNLLVFNAFPTAPGGLDARGVRANKTFQIRLPPDDLMKCAVYAKRRGRNRPMSYLDAPLTLDAPPSLDIS